MPEHHLKTCPVSGFGAAEPSQPQLNDAPILDQLEGQWQKLTGLILFKLLQKGQEVEITADDMQRYQQEWPAGAVIFTHGRHSSIAVKLISAVHAADLAAYEAMRRGHG
jgi:hypothetical protein